MNTLLPPPITAPTDVDTQLAQAGYAVLSADGLCTLLGLDDSATLDRLRPFWDRLPPDAHLRDGGRYRRRRHGSFVIDDGLVAPVEHRPHWQPVEYNALHGGLQRWFQPLEPDMLAEPVLPALLAMLAVRADRLRGARRWFAEVHPFRIDTTDGIGRPTPEGAHRDGVDLVAVLLVDRVGIRGGETRVFEAGGPHGLRFSMTERWTTLLLDDSRVIHESTPIQPDEVEVGHRDTLVVTLRAGGFQDAPVG